MPPNISGRITRFLSVAIMRGLWISVPFLLLPTVAGWAQTDSPLGSKAIELLRDNEELMELHDDPIVHVRCYTKLAIIIAAEVTRFQQVERQPRPNQNAGCLGLGCRRLEITLPTRPM